MTTMQSLLVENYAAMRAFARRLTKNTTSADDVTQSACLIALEASIDPASITHPKAWLNRCVLNSYYTFVKKFVRPMQNSVEFAPEDERMGADGGQEYAVELSQAFDLIGKMPVRRQDVVTMTMAGFTLNEIAATLGVFQQTVSYNLRKAREALLSGALPVDGRALHSGRWARSRA